MYGTLIWLLSLQTSPKSNIRSINSVSLREFVPSMSNKRSIWDTCLKTVIIFAVSLHFTINNSYFKFPLRCSWCTWHCNDLVHKAAIKQQQIYTFLHLSFFFYSIGCFDLSNGHAFGCYGYYISSRFCWCHFHQTLWGWHSFIKWYTWPFSFNWIWIWHCSEQDYYK